ncbi:Hsp20/alpha crystallin family protein [Rhizobium rhizogenes]|jgi:HSP20 family protein|uniref:Hsp20/alpha crystallin family protein n=1 Tax=Rhizobium rhizogenes TaxID=359 RepID=UPI000565CF17|nr:Hsp20/alpha crystallin family protein [Rhizobium rhizogenes]NTF85336.1 Hsp20/alpha crystallin family protein [Rhizobium rhizogenes]NTI78161.1 Hsp20/alpha crystallin family protein [Rhizobium rhizogenes]
MADLARKLSVGTEMKTAPAMERWAPFEGLRSEIDRVFNDFTPGFFDRTLARFPNAFTRGVPAVDFVESDKAYELTAELPGIDAKELELTLANGILTVKGEKQERKEEKEKEYYLSERRYGSFQRSLQLPDGVDAEKIDASFANGVLKVVLPKTPKAQKNDRKIAIKAA